MEGILLVLAIFFICTFFLGRFIEKAKIPWIFAALIIGMLLSIKNPFSYVTSSDSFNFLSELGMLFLLFIIGFELNFKKIFTQRYFIFKSAFIIIFSEAILGSLFIRFFFGIDWVLSIVIASAFATVGEAILLPILDDFKITKTSLGQSIIGVGVLDDFIEIITIIVASVILGRSAGHAQTNIFLSIGVLIMLFSLVFLLVKFHKELPNFRFKDIPSFFLFVMFFIFLFSGIGSFVESAPLGALLAGIALRNIVPEEKLRVIDSEIRTLAYGFLAPIFFLSIGLTLDLTYLSNAIEYVLLLVILVSVTKILSAYFVGRKKLGKRKSIVFGVALTVKLSTSIVIIKLLLDEGFIGQELYSVLVASTMIFSFLTPFVLSTLIKLWRIGFHEIKKPNFK